jgi:NitT/TauT family transport system ATP-binding protein
MTEMGLRCEKLGHSFVSRGKVVRALENISFSANPGEFICIVGPSGCGKTTLLRILAGLLEPDSGTVTFGNPSSLTKPSTALVFQEHGVFPWLNVRENVAFGLEMKGVERADREQRADALLRDVGLDGFAASYPHELSVGMRQ